MLYEKHLLSKERLLYFHRLSPLANLPHNIPRLTLRIVLVQHRSLIILLPLHPTEHPLLDLLHNLQPHVPILSRQYHTLPEQSQ